MGRKFKVAVLLLMIALIPVRAFATVTVGFCAMHAHGDAAPSEHGNGVPDGGIAHAGMKYEQCNACFEHCASAAIVAPSKLALPSESGARRIVSAERFADGFIPKQVDRPPLVL